MSWFAQPDDLVGGFIVTNLDAPMSQHDFRPEGDPAKRGYVFAECRSMDDARFIAYFLNHYGVAR